MTAVKEPEKQSQSSPQEVFNAQCPVCPGVAISNYIYKMQDSKTKDISYWNRCQCGVVWQHKYPDGINNYYGEKYIKELLKDKEKYSDACMYYCRTYAPILEELMYGRKLLDVGYTHPYNMQAFSIRGWIPFGIDCNDEASESHRLIKGNFEDYEFPKDGDDFVGTRYDLVWMNHVLENMKEPVKALQKAYDLLNPSGCIFIATPDTDMIFTNSSGAYKYWREKEHYIMWNIESLTRQLERIGFEVILKRRNHENRYLYEDDIHVIAQKRFF